MDFDCDFVHSETQKTTERLFQLLHRASSGTTLLEEVIFPISKDCPPKRHHVDSRNVGMLWKKNGIW
jgi:hypothetical protein